MSWSLPTPMQLCYVVPDLDAALAHWTRRIGAGPFFVLKPQFKEQWYRGEPAAVEITMALGYWGDLQLEFVQQDNAAASPYRDFVGEGRYGAHHLGVLSQSLDADLEQLAQRGLQRLYWGESTAGIRFAYVDSDQHPGGMIELIQSTPEVLGLFAALRQAARDWDGSDPVRQVG